MQTIIAGFSEKNELGYDSLQRNFVLRYPDNQTFPYHVIFNVSEVSEKVKEFILAHDVSSSDLDQLISALNQRKVQFISSEDHSPFIKQILAVAYDKLKISKDRENIDAVAKIYSQDILTGPFKVEDFKEELKQKRNFKIVLAQYPHETSHTLYCYDPEKRMVSKATTKGLDVESIAELSALLRRKWQARDAFVSFKAEEYPKLKVFRLDSDHKLSVADLKAQTSNTVFIQVSNDCSHFRAMCYFEKKGESFGRIVNLTSKNLHVLHALIKSVEQLVQVYNNYQDSFAPASQQGKITKESFINQARDKVWLEVLKEAYSVIRVHYFDSRDNTVKSKDLSLNEMSGIDNFTMQLNQLKTELLANIPKYIQETKAKFSGLIIEGKESESIEDLKGTDKVKIAPYSNSQPQNSTFPSHKIFYFDPYSKKISSINTEGIAPEAVQQALELIARKRQSAPIFQTHKLKQFQYNIAIAPSPDHRTFTVSFAHPDSPDVRYQLSTKNLADLGQTIEASISQRQELLTMKPTDTVLKSLSAASSIEVPPAPPGINLKDIINLFEKIEWIDPKSPWYRDPSTLRDDGVPVSVSKYKEGIDKIARLASNPANIELNKVMAHNIQLLKDEKDLSLVTRSILDLAEGGLHCEGRELGVALSVYRNLHRKADAAIGKHVPYGINLIHQWIDDLKLEVVDEMIAEGTNFQNSHESIFYLKTLEKSYALPDSLFKEYTDINAACALYGKFNTEESAKSGFLARFNSKRIIDTVVENTRVEMDSRPNQTGSGIQELLRVYVETILINQFPEIKTKLESLTATYHALQEGIRLRKDINKEEKITLLEAEGRNFESKKVQCLDSLIEDHKLFIADNTYTKFELTRLGAIALLLYSKLISSS